MREQKKHPCFNAVHGSRSGRIHLPVAPRCNVRCAYCERIYDCVNEGRPGVTSRLLTAEEAVSWAAEMVTRDPRISVAGIAGPGDPLCNEETFVTLGLLRQRLPELIACVSTNGLLLADLASTLKELGVATVSVTVNAVDPAIAAKIYSSVDFGGKELAGREGAEVLIRRQLAGIAEAAAIGLKVKINTVVCPGINMKHLREIAVEVKKRGGSVLNIMPLIPCGGFSNIRMPNKTEIENIRQACEAIIPVMRHCQQCRSDAVGLLEAKIQYR